MRTFFEALLALLAFALSWPLFVAIALLIVIDSPGNPFHLAGRIGKDGRPFRMWKFRSMVVGAPRLGPPITGSKDPRVTRAGRFLRRTKLDELPQLFNVVLGDMTFVGPRPESPEIVALYTAEERAVLAVKPGLTGCVQVHVKDEPRTIPHDVEAADYYIQHLMKQKLRRDLEYLKTRTYWSDLRIVVSTVFLVLHALVPMTPLVPTVKPYSGKLK